MSNFIYIIHGQIRKKLNHTFIIINRTFIPDIIVKVCTCNANLFLEKITELIFITKKIIAVIIYDDTLE